MKKLFTLILIAYIVFNINTAASANAIQESIYQNSNICELADSNENIRGVFEDFDFKEIANPLHKKSYLFNPENILSKAFGLFAHEIKTNIHTMILLVVLSIIWAIVSNIQSSYNTKGVSQSAFFAFYPIILGLIIKGMNDCLTLAEQAISDQVLFMKSAVPVYIGIVMSTGYVTSAMGMEPVFLYFIQLISGFMEKIVLPLVFWISVLNMTNCITDRFSIRKLIEFVKQVIKWTLGITMTLFIGILGMSGIATSVSDGLGIKTLKYAVGNFVPVVGGLLSDSVNTVLSSISLIKNTVGIAGVITIVLMCAVPAIKMLALIGVFKLTAGVVEPLSDKRITEMISEAANTVTFIFLILFSVTIMFILGVTIVLNIGNKI